MTDVAVVGAGIVGAAVARELAVRGIGVTLLDRGAVSSGTTGLGEGNVLCSDKDAGPELELTRAGLALFGELEERLGAVARIRRKGALIVHPEPDTWAGEPARLARMGSAEAELLEPGDVRRLEPELTGPVHGASRFPGDLQCDPRAIARALAAEAVAAGAALREDCAVERVAGDGVVLAGGERIAAGAVVLAAGAWSAPLAEAAGLPLPVEPRKGQLVRLAAPAPGLVRHKVVDGSYLRVGGERRVRPAGLDGRGDDLGGRRPRRLLARAARLRHGRRPGGERRDGRARGAPVPATVGAAPAAAWAGLRPWLPDHLPAIGPSRRVPGLWVATGHEGAGVALGPVTGRLVAQLLAGEPPVVDPAPFDPDRFASHDIAAAAH